MALAALGALQGAPAAADPSGPGAAVARELPGMVVSGTRTERSADDAPVRVEVVPRAEIERTGALTLTEALENVPGLHLTEVHGKSGHQVSMQGLSSEQVLVLIDGLPITASTGSTVDLSQFTLTNVERIEVVKGASSALYGSSAMGGVINVITRDPRAGLGGRVELDAGTRFDQNASGESLDAARRQLQASLEGGSARWRWRLSGATLDDDGFSPAPESYPLPGDRIGRQDLVARLAWLGDADRRAWVEAARYEETGEQRYERLFAPNLVPYRRVEDIGRNRLTGGLRIGTTRGWSGEIKGVHERFESDSMTTANGTPVIVRDADLGSDQLSLQADLPPLGAHSLQFGADWRRDSLSQTNNGVSEIAQGRVEREAYEFFAQDSWFVGDRTEWLPGVRWQHDSDFGSHVAPKVAVRHELAGLAGWQAALRASLGAGYRVPNLKERYFVFDHSALGYTVGGNPDLQPESSTSLQLGTSLRRGNALKLDFNAFANRVHDLIQVEEAGIAGANGVQAFTYENVARALTWGLEAGTEYLPSPAWRLFATYTYTRTRDRDGGGELTRRPRSIARVGADWRIATATSIAARLRLQSSELVGSASGARSPGFTELDLTLNHDLGAGLEAFAALHNAFDAQRDFADPDDFRPKSGRLLMLGLRLRFGNARN